jgi:hypothetical protein
MGRDYESGEPTHPRMSLSESMRVSFLFIFVRLSLLSFSSHAAGESKSLCTADEELFFTCSLRGKLVSLCASPRLSKDSGYLVYRFGVFGKQPELVYPEPIRKPSEAFALFFSSYAKGSSTQLTFQRGQFSYTLYHESNVFDVNGSGIAIDKSGERVSHLKCNNKTIDAGELYKLRNLGIPEVKFRDLP